MKGNPRCGGTTARVQVVRAVRAVLVGMPTAPIKSAWIIATVCIAAPRERFTTSRTHAGPVSVIIVAIAGPSFTCPEDMSPRTCALMCCSAGGISAEATAAVSASDAVAAVATVAAVVAATATHRAAGVADGGACGAAGAVIGVAIAIGGTASVRICSGTVPVLLTASGTLLFVCTHGVTSSAFPFKCPAAATSHLPM